MTPKRALPSFLLFAFLFSLAFNANAQQNKYFTNGQSWGKQDHNNTPAIGPANLILFETVYVVRTKSITSLYYLQANGTDGLTIMSANQKHFIPLPSKNISFSKSCIYITPLNQDKGHTGFYVIRISDLVNFSFHANIPLFFIPTDNALGKIESVAVETQDGHEEKLFLHTDNKEVGIIQMHFKDIEDILKAEIFSLAILQLMSGTHAPKLQTLINNLQKDIEGLYKELFERLHEMGGKDSVGFVPDELKNTDWKTATAEDLANSLAKLEENAQLVELKKLFSKKLSVRVSQFYENYNNLIHTIDISSVVPADINQIKEALDPTHKAGFIDLDDPDSQKALKIYGGIALGAIFVTLVLPKMLKKPFSKVAAEYSSWHFRTLNTSWLRYVINKVNPRYLENSTSKMATFIRRLGPMEPKVKGLVATSSQFKRAFFQMLGDTLTVAISEVLTRPFFRKIGEKDSDSAILIDQPFDETHSLWLQKNLLFRVVGNQVLGSMMGSANLAILEREYNKILQKYVFNAKVEEMVTEQVFRRSHDKLYAFSEQQRHNLGKMMIDDLDGLKTEIRVKAKEMIANNVQGPYLSGEILHNSVDDLKLKWVKEIEKSINKSLGPSVKVSFQFTAEAKAALTEHMGHRIQSMALGLMRKQMEGTTQKVGMVRKMTKAIGTYITAASNKIFGKRLTKSTSSLGSEVWKIWTSQNEPYFWNSIAMQLPTRGSFNMTMYLFQRTTSLTFTTPFYISTYMTAKRRLGLSGGSGEFLFGFFYGLVTNTVTQYIFVNVYEKNIMHTAFDLELSKYTDYFIDDPESPQEN